MLYNTIALSVAGFIIAQQLRKYSLPDGNKDRIFPWLCLMLMYFVAFYKYIVYG